MSDDMSDVMSDVILNVRVRGERGRAWAAPPQEAAVRASRQPSCDTRASLQFLVI